jgi:hypothetical protein
VTSGEQRARRSSRSRAAERRLRLDLDARLAKLESWISAATSHSPLGHLLSILGHARGESTVSELTPLLKEAGFSDVEAIPTRHGNFAFIRAS